jgi:signal transduction histidine kinase/CheY-like chemotaxis protein
MRVFADTNPAYLFATLLGIVCLGYLFFIIKTTKGNWSSKINREYILAVLCIGVSSFCYALMTIAENTIFIRLFWSVAYAAFFFFLPAWIRFASTMFTVKHGALKFVFRRLFFYTSTVVAALALFSQDILFVHTNSGVRFNFGGNWFFRVAGMYAFILAVTVIIAHILWWRESVMQRQRIQQTQLLVLTLLFAPIGYFTDFIIPAFTSHTVTPIASVLLFPAAFSLYRSMQKNRTMNITSAGVSEHIFNSVTIPTLVLDYKNTVHLTNEAAIELFEENLLGKPIFDFLPLPQDNPGQYNNNTERNNIPVTTPKGIRLYDILFLVEKDKYGDALFKTVVLHDVTAHEYKDALLMAVNDAAIHLLNSDADTFENDLLHTMGVLAHAVKVDCVYIWQNHKTEDDKLYCTQRYEWSEQTTVYNEDKTLHSYDDVFPGWEALLSKGEIVNGPLRQMPQEVQAFLAPVGCISILVMPIIFDDNFWGFIGFDDNRYERVFTKTEEMVLHSASLLLASAFIRNDMMVNMQRSSEHLKVALARATSAGNAKSTFLSNMSHEIRTPLNTIMGMASIGLKATDLHGAQYALTKISTASYHLLSIISDILDIVKIDAEEIKLEFAEFHFESMIQKILSVIRFKSDEKKQILSVGIDGTIPPYIISDKLRLTQAISHILSNAVKFTHEGGNVRFTVAKTAISGDICELRIIIADDGIGISAEDQAKIFEAFEQTESGISREFGGAGLGLAIAKRIIELMGGTIEVASEPKKGAAFTITIPVKCGIKNEDTASAAAEAHASDKNILAGKRILIAEDIEINREILMSVLDGFGLIIDCVDNGKQALDTIIANPDLYDFIFMDIQMPQMDGLEATRLIRSLTTTRQRGRLPIVAMTANVFQDDIKACLEAGMDGHLGKPLDIDKLMETLRRYLITV